MSPATADRASASSAVSASSTSKACGPATRTREPLLAEIAALDAGAAATRRMQEIYAAADQAGADARRASRRCATRGVTVAGALSPQRTQQFWKTVVDAGRGPVRHPRHDGLRRARLGPRGAAEPQAVHLRARRAGDRRRLRDVHRGAAPDAHRRGRRPRRLRRRRRRTPRATTLGIHAPMATAIADVAAARRDYMDESGGRYVHVIADGGMGRSGELVEGDRLRRGRRHARLGAGPRDGGAGPRLPLGPGGAPPERAARRAGGRRHRRHAARRSSTGPAAPPTARRTSSARCAGRWRPPATATSRSSSGWRSWSRRTSRPDPGA